MAVRLIELLQRCVHRMGDTAAPLEDTVLLERFVAANDRDAFELLMARHGALVLGTARRLVANAHDAEDVFQAVFLSLARLAKSIRQGNALPAWLHRTTCRVAAKLRSSRHTPSAPAEPMYREDPAAGLEWREVCQALDEELERLPERLRTPLLLCYLSGLTRDEAAKQLGWSLGTLKRRLEAGREVLRGRLARRGIGTVGLALTVLTPGALQAAVGQSLRDATLGVVFSTSASVPATVAALAVGSTGSIRGLAMKSIFLLLAAIGLGVGIYTATGQADVPQQADAQKDEVAQAKAEQAGPWDDPLPQRSTLRFGTSRFRHGIPVSVMAVSKDAKVAVAVNGNHILGSARAFDLVTGRMLYTLGRQGSADSAANVEAAAISPDGRTLVTKQDNFSLRVRDAASGAPLRKIDLPPTNQWSMNEWVAFTPDGKAIAVTSQGGVIHLIDVETGKTIRDFSNANPESSLGPGWTSVLGIAFSPDGKLMASGGFVNDKGNYFARLWDVATGKELRRFMHGKSSYGIPSLAFSPDARILGTRAHDGRLRLFDVDTGKERKTFPADGGGRRLGTVAFSPDSKTVAAAGDAIRLFDVTTGEERLRIDRKQATGLVFADDGKTLIGAVTGAIYRWDTATGKALTPEAGDSIVEQILVTADGRRVVTRGQDGDAHVWDGQTGAHLRGIDAAWQRGVAMSPDGRFLVWPVSDPSVKYTHAEEPNTIYHGSRLTVYDLAAGKTVDRFGGFHGDANDLMFTDGGKTLITVDHAGGSVRIWNFNTGKEERSFSEAERKMRGLVWRSALSPDGKTLALGYDAVQSGRGLGDRNAPHLVRLWDVATGKVKHTLEGHTWYVLDIAFSPDGRLLATAGERGPAFVWDTTSGKRVAALPKGLPVTATAIAFSRDGRFLVTALAAGPMRVWETATWTVRNDFPGHRDRPTVLTFTPAGQLLSGSVDTTVLAWDLRPPRVAGSVPLDEAWKVLAAGEASEAFKVEGRFLSAPVETVQLFAKRIKPPPALDPKRMRQWLADLDSDEFTLRDAAARSIAELDHQAIPYLEAALKTAVSLEARRRMEQLLEQQLGGTITPEQLRKSRAVMILELIGDDAARGLFKQWAAGPAGARLTMDASASLRRLGVRESTVSKEEQEEED
jgi:RNA polymerase sigma factor (sigma-70 family)